MDRLGLEKKLRDFPKIKSEIMRAIANNSVNFFKVTNFDADAFVDQPSQAWAPRKNNSDPGRRLLVKTGRGRASIHTKTISANKITIVCDTPYMNFHNEGTGILPKRQFMGESKVLNQQNMGILQSYLIHYF